MADEPSRLSSGNIYYRGGYISMEEYRNMISSRNLYNLENEYESTQLFSPRNQSNVAQSISTVLNVIPQYNRMQVNTNLAGNIYDAFRDNGSPLARIGLIMLGKHIAYNSAMNLSVKYLPSIDLSQVLKGNPNKIFKLNEQNTITVKNKEDKTFLDKVGSTASNFLGIDTYDVFGDANPFSKNPTNIDYVRNTGEAQLTRFFKAIDLNLYKPFIGTTDPYSELLLEYGDKVGVKLDLSSVSILSKQPTFTFGNKKFHKYSTIKFDSTAVDIANISMDISYSGNTDTILEYAPSADYIINNFGTTVKPELMQGFDTYVQPVSNFSDDNLNDKIIWGKDGVEKDARTYLNMLRGDEDKIVAAEENNPKDFNIRKGLLEYTKNLLNASSGQFVDITRKSFVKSVKGGRMLVGFQGSPLWRANDSDYAIKSGNNTGKGAQGKAGVRQHTVLDPYGSDSTILDGTMGFAKAIRFKGNIVYNVNSNGNQNSVIYKTVLPRIHPTMDENGGGINNKNLMFSLENLAIGTIKRDKFGVIDDEYGTPIPLSEVGPFAGRLMWFPPYNLQLNEVAIAKYESTVMVGRNEPMYNYMNSERTAVLSFSLLVDYPEQLRNLNLKGNDRNKAIADFFAFGGDPLPEEYRIEEIEKKIEELRDQIPEIGNPVEQAEVPELDVKKVEIFFPNDMPTATEVDTIINTMYQSSGNSGLHYEIIVGLESAQDGNGFGLNKDVYFRTGLTRIENTTKWKQDQSLFVDQYTNVAPEDQLGISLLNKNLLDVYGNEDTRKYYNIGITGGASKLYLNENEKAYNEALGDRRISATKKLIYSKLTVMFGKTVADDIIENNLDTDKSAGSAGSGELGAKPENMHLEEVKKERRATIEFKRNNVTVDKKEQTLTPKQQEDIAKIQQDIQSLERQRDALQTQINENIYKERNKAILNSFESISGNQFYPVFHSQTPEDFHRRLTFLQQCTRQGAAKRYDIKDDDGNLRARNSVFGRQPICVLRVGDFFYTKVIIESVTIDYADTTWDMNPEGFGMQPMMANINLQMKLIGGQSLKGPIDALQNAVTFNYYANSTFTDKGMYARPSKEATKQNQYMFGVDDGTGTGGGIVGGKIKGLTDAYDALTNKVTEGDK